MAIQCRLICIVPGLALGAMMPLPEPGVLPALLRKAFGAVLGAAFE
ncbi:hypothetical protein [Beijerinckia mobilis]|nr:hypothetical protein [Beijerinckia mobilis]